MIRFNPRYKLCSWDVQGSTETKQDFQGGRLLVSFKEANVGTMNARLLSELLLGKACLFSEFSKFSAEHTLKLHWMEIFVLRL
jgi:hypothetical protein